MLCRLQDEVSDVRKVVRQEHNTFAPRDCATDKENWQTGNRYRYIPLAPEASNHGGGYFRQRRTDCNDREANNEFAHSQDLSNSDGSLY